MDSTERLAAVFNRQKPDRIPVFSFMGSCASALAGVKITEYYQSPATAIDLQVKAKNLFQYDDSPGYGWADWGGWEFGGQIAFPKSYKESSPRTVGSLIKKPGDVDSLQIPDPETAGMMPLVHEFNRHITAMGQSAKIQGGSVTLLASAIIGRDRLFRWYVKEPEAVKVVYHKAAAFILKAARYTIDQYGAENCGAGFSAAMDTNDLISPDIFAEFCVPALSHVNSSLMSFGIDNFSLHLCGNHRHNLKLWASLPWPERMTISLGPETDIQVAAEAFQHKHIIAGNVSTSALAHGSYEEVYQDATRCINDGKDLPGGFILMSGCEMPVLAPPVNIHAMVRAVEELGRYN